MLLWDLDPQAAARFLFRVRPRVKGGGKALIAGKRPVDDAIKATDFENLDLLPADFTYRNLDLHLDSERKSVSRLRSLLTPLRREFDLVVRVTVWGVAAGVVGARLYHDVTSWNEVPSPKWQGIFEVWRGGLGVWGGILLGTLAGAIVLTIYSLLVYLYRYRRLISDRL